MTAIGKVKADILAFYARSHARAGDAFNFRAFIQGVMTDYTDEQRKLVDEALRQLAEEGLVDRQDGSYCLTAKGVKSIRK